MNRFQETLLLMLAGGALGLAAPGYGLWPLAWVGLVPLIVWAAGQTRWPRALGGGRFGADDLERTRERRDRAGREAGMR